MRAKLSIYLRLLRLNRPIGILLVLWPVLWALWIANAGYPGFKLLCIFVLGAIVMRSAGCVINDIADRDFDGSVARTKSRPLAAKILSIKEAWIIFVILCLIGFILVLQLNWLTIALSLVALVLAVIYPFTKRVTHLPQVFLGITFNWGVPMAFAASTNSLPLIAWYLLLIACLWTIIYDTLYAMTDLPDDIKIGIKSTAILFGNNTQLILAILQFIMFALLLGLGWWKHLSIGFYLSVIIAIAFAVYQQYLIKDRLPQRCFQAFLNNNWIGLVLFLGLMLG